MDFPSSHLQVSRLIMGNSLDRVGGYLQITAVESFTPILAPLRNPLISISKAALCAFEYLTISSFHQLDH
jgi:hypothetical protein